MIPQLSEDLQKKLLAMPAQEVIARTAYGESDCLGLKGMCATINTMQNRLKSGVKWWGKTLKDIALYKIDAPYHQYSVWNSDNKRLPHILSVTDADDNYMLALTLADTALSGELADITKGATHYYNPDIVKTPSWARGRSSVFQLGSTMFYRVTD